MRPLPFLLVASVTLVAAGAGSKAEAAPKPKASAAQKKKAPPAPPARKAPLTKLKSLDPAPEAPAPQSSAPPPSRGPTRIDFDDRLIQGQTNKSGAVYLYDRKELKTKSMVKKRESFREEIIGSVYDS